MAQLFRARTCISNLAAPLPARSSCSNYVRNTSCTIPRKNISTRTLSQSTVSHNKSKETFLDSPFAFLPANALVSKTGRGERSKGMTEIRGSYYNPVTYTYLNELLSDWGGLYLHNIDYISLV